MMIKLLEIKICNTNTTLQFNSILYSLEAPDQWYMKFIKKYTNATGLHVKEKGEAKYNKYKKRKNKYRIHGNVNQKSQGNNYCFRLY